MKTIPNPEFLPMARKYIAIAGPRRKDPMTADDVRAHFERKGIIPENWNCLGKLFCTGQWREVGYVQSRVPSRQGGRQLLWEYAGGCEA